MKINLKRGDLELSVEFSDADIQALKLKSAGKVREFLVALELHKLNLGSPVAAPPSQGAAVGFEYSHVEDD